MKKDMKNLAYLLTKYPRDPIIRGRFFTLKKSINKTIKQTLIDQRNTILNKIQQAENKCPTTFWKLVNTIKNKKQKNECIEPNVMYDYYKELHSKKFDSRFDKNFEKDIEDKMTDSKIQGLDWIDILDSPISYQEILDTA